MLEICYCYYQECFGFDRSQLLLTLLSGLSDEVDARFAHRPTCFHEYVYAAMQVYCQCDYGQAKFKAERVRTDYLSA